MVKRKRIKETTQRRTYLGSMNEFDNTKFNGVIQEKANAEEQHIIQYIMRGAWFKNEDKIEFGMSETDICELRGEKEEDITHALWDCKKIYTGDSCKKLKELSRTI